MEIPVVIFIDVSINPTDLFPYFPTSQFPRFHIPHFLVSILRRAISVGPLGGRQGCHCQHPELSPQDANTARKSKAPSQTGPQSSTPPITQVAKRVDMVLLF